MTPVSRETRGRLEVYVDLLKKWQPSTNLVSPATLADIWTRHVEDSLQLLPLAEAEHWADLGTGAGLPGLIVAASRPAMRMTLIESDGRKCAFLRLAAQAMALPKVQVELGRIEVVLPRLTPAPDVVSARALAPLTKLLAYAREPLAAGAVGLFPKGKGHAEELTDARKSWHFEADLIPSETDPSARIIRVRDFRGPAQD